VAYIFAADIFCDDCGKYIKRAVAAESIDGRGLVEWVDFEGHDDMTYNEQIDDIVDQLDRLDETCYDSDDYPKYCSDDAEADCPQHCGSHEHCINAIGIEGGKDIGDWIGNDLTSDGIEYVKEAVREGGPVAELWKEYYDWIDFGACLGECAICGWPGVNGDGLCLDCQRCDDECRYEE